MRLDGYVGGIGSPLSRIHEKGCRVWGAEAGVRQGRGLGLLLLRDAHKEMGQNGVVGTEADTLPL